MFLDHTTGQAHTRLDSSERVISPRRGHYLLNVQHTYTHNRRTSMLSAGFEPAIPGIKRLQTYALVRMAPRIITFLLSVDRIRASFRNVFLNQNQTIKTGRYKHVNTITLLTFKGWETWSLKIHILRMYDKVGSVMLLPNSISEAGQYKKIS
jgi:hypothetical protein